MRDPSYWLREAVNAALSGIEYQSVIVPIFDMLTDDMTGFPRIIIGPLSGSGNRESKCGFGSIWQQNIKISSAFPGGAMVTQDIVDIISDEILERIVPFSAPFIDLSGNGFDVWDINANIAGSLVYEDKARKYIDKNLIILYTITEI